MHAMAFKQQPPTIYKISVELEEIEPIIWRRFLVPSTVTLHRLHLILQEVMGWTNSHLYRFEIGKKEYGMPNPDNEFYELDFENSMRAKLGATVASERKFVYEYDFGDGWTHKLTVEDIIDAKPRERYPLCLEGERACPPEDCGGPRGYIRMLSIVANPLHEEFEETVTWLGQGFRPAAFNAERVNRRLKPIPVSPSGSK